jgi:hypothetical protein
VDYRSEFAEFEGVTYLNAAGQGPLPLASARAAQAALEWEKLPTLFISACPIASVRCFLN